MASSTARSASAGSRPASTASSSAASAAVRASGPTADRPHQCSAAPPGSGTSPVPGLRPTSPQYAAGTRIDPPPSVPRASAAIPAATAAALPPLEPPGSRDGSSGLRVVPSAEWVKPHAASSGIRVVPTTTAPARRSRLTSSSSRRAGVGRGGGGAVAGGVAGDGHVVLDRDGHARQREREPVRAGVDPAGLGEHPLGVGRLERAEVGVALGDPAEVRPGDLDGGAGAAAHPGGERGRRQRGQLRLGEAFPRND